MDLVVDIVSVVLVVNILSVHNKTTNLDSAYQNYLDLGPPKHSSSADNIHLSPGIIVDIMPSLIHKLLYTVCNWNQITK